MLKFGPRNSKLAKEARSRKIGNVFAFCQASSAAYNVYSVGNVNIFLDYWKQIVYR